MNPVLLHKQLRDNASELEQFSRDLQNWGEEMKSKEKMDASPKPKVQKLEKIHIKSPKADKIPIKSGSTDYSKWEKFDADAACDRLEGDVNDDSELSDEIDEKARDEAMLKKEKGNKFVKNKQWDEAIKCYTSAIKLYSHDPVFYANRALCHLKNNNFFAAEKDCTLSLKLDKTYVKALQRRAAANEGLNNLEAAEFDLVQVSILEPNNKESKAALDNVRKKLGKASKPVEQRPISKFTASRNAAPILSPSTLKSSTFKPDSVPIITKVSEKAEIKEHKPQEKVHPAKISFWPKDDKIVLVKPINKPPHMRSKKSLKRIEIVETDEMVKPENHIVKPKVQQNIQQKMEEKLSEKILEGAIKKVTFRDNTIQKHETYSEPKSTFAFKRKKDEMKSALDNVVREVSWPKPNENTSTFKTDDLKILERKLEQENNLIVKNVTKSEAVGKSYQEEIKSFITPKTSVQFYKMWRESKTEVEKYEMLKQIDPSEIPNIFKESLDFDIFSKILDILSSKFVENRAPVFEILIHFTEVKRFSAFTMFMDSTDKNCLWKLITYIREVELKAEEVENLIKKYEL